MFVCDVNVCVFVCCVIGRCICVVGVHVEHVYVIVYVCGMHAFVWYMFHMWCVCLWYAECEYGLRVCLYMLRVFVFDLCLCGMWVAYLCISVWCVC